MTITVDCRWIDSSGVGVYLRECLPYFLDSGNDFLLMGNEERLAPFLAGRENAAVLECSIKPFSLRELLAFPRNMLKKINKTDVYYSPYFNIPGGITVPVYTTIHDIIFPDMPELTSRLGLAARTWFYRRAFGRSKKIFTVSEFSKSRIDHYSGKKVPVIVTHSAIQPWILEKRKIRTEKTNTLLFIGNIKKHKGLKILLEAFSLARQEGLEYKLVIAGSGENFRSSDDDLSFGSGLKDPGAIKFTGFLPDEKLLALLEESSLLVQPSLYEGFCLPPLEAMTAGTPALISDIPVLREIYQDYPRQSLGEEFPVHWFRAGDSRDLKEKIISLLHHKKLRETRLSGKLENLYTFEKTSRKILENLEGK